MHINCSGNNAILLLILIFAMRDANCKKKSQISDKTDDRSGFWMSAMGTIQESLINVQAIIVKDENVKGYCENADRKSTKIHLMCAGSILNRHHVITSASCIHISTHIRHNVRGILAVAIAPLNPNMQVIKVLEYKVNRAHDANPYSQHYLKHNIAILKLACRINMEILHKIELPRAPFVNSCEEDNCIVAIYRRMKKTRWVMHQILAPQVPLQNRRRKETMTKDEDLRKIVENDNIVKENRVIKRTKRKLAERPDFTSHYETRNHSWKKYESSANFAKNSTILNSSIEPTTKIMDETKSPNISVIISLEDIVREDRSGPISNKTIRSFVVRSSDGHRGCAQTGAPVMLNRTQLAIASVPCDDRQPWRRWGYTDLYDNLDWIGDTLKNWNGNTTTQPVMSPASESTSPVHAQENKTSCSTCIFNFFIDFGCKKNGNKCGGKTKDGKSLNFHPSRKTMNGLNPRQRKKKVQWKKPQGCQRTFGGNAVFARGCRKKIDASAAISDDPPAIFERKAPGSEKTRYSQRAANDETSGLEKSVTVGSIETIVIDDRRDDDDEYASRGDSPISDLSYLNSQNPRTMKIPPSFDGKNERADNEIALQNIDDDPIDWLAENNKDLEIERGIEPKFHHSHRPFRKIRANRR